MRRGVPQGGHTHVLQPRGAQVLDELLPGVLDELTRAGAVPVDLLMDLRATIGGRLIASTPVGAAGVQASRPFLERHIRERVRAGNAYMDRLLAAAEHDTVVARQFGRVIGMLDAPASLTHPAILRRVLLPVRVAGRRLPPSQYIRCRPQRDVRGRPHPDPETH